MKKRYGTIKFYAVLNFLILRTTLGQFITLYPFCFARFMVCL